ncbi:metallophosphoesterase family protein [Burkholderia sp. 22PA0106]|uniref:metallophosphoesterase family protein n=1 Tax=Burkholderia sp. 22PA0106 TaxID=3237371 RepID=UPI0039C21701
MTTLLQISDPHFGAERPAAVEALVRLAAQLQPALVVMSGDLTQRARRGQFDAARAFVARLAPLPVLAIPGNHDLPLFDLVSRWRRPYANYRRAFGAALEPEFDTPALLVLGVNTTRAARHAAGEISAAQVDRVARRLERAGPAQLRVAVVHQPIVAADPTNRHDLLHGRDAALRRWADAGIDLVLGGHTHLPGIWPVAALARPVYGVQGGTAVSRRLRDGVPNSVNRIDYLASPGGPRRAIVTRYDYDPAHPDFIAQPAQTLELAPGR